MAKALRIVNSAMKATSGALLLALFLQPVLAGRYFSGDADAISLHGSLGELAAWLALVLAVLALCRAALRDMGWTGASALVVLFALTGLQVHFGHAGSLDLHIPLGASLLAASLLATVWLFRAKPTAAEG
jgi:uncharacterized membrane protein YhaH (DUF805 family)